MNMNARHNDPYAIASDIVLHLPLDYTTTATPINFALPARLINSDKVPQLAEELTEIIAHVVASLIDAGSERDAVNEDLTPHIERELYGWSDNPDLAPDSR